MKELYVYYCIGEAGTSEALSQVEGVFAALKAAHPGLQARLLRRVQPEKGQETWMEVYTRKGGITPDLQAAIEAATLEVPRARKGARHLEAFEPLDAC